MYGPYIVHDNENYWTLIVFMIDVMDMPEITNYSAQPKAKTRVILAFASCNYETENCYLMVE